MDRHHSIIKYNPNLIEMSYLEIALRKQGYFIPPDRKIRVSFEDNHCA